MLLGTTESLNENDVSNKIIRTMECWLVKKVDMQIKNRSQLNERFLTYINNEN